MLLQCALCLHVYSDHIRTTPPCGHAAPQHEVIPVRAGSVEEFVRVQGRLEGNLVRCPKCSFTFGPWYDFKK